MSLGRFATRYDGWRRGPALAVLALLAAALVAIAWPGEPLPLPRAGTTSSGGQTDMGLYRAIIDRVATGEQYYAVAADELRQGGYPLRPFLTFRLPTLAVANARFGTGAMNIGLALLALGVLVSWWRRLGSVLPLRLRAGALVLLIGGTMPMTRAGMGSFHESWAALLLALMIALRRPGRAGAAILVGAVALAVRETALPMVLAMGGLAALERRWREALGWAAIVALFALGLVIHADLVAEVVRPDDRMSPGWAGLLGPGFAVGAIAAWSAAILLPPGLTAVTLMLSLWGWISVATGWALRGSLLLLGYGAMLALFARADTFYWGLLAAPLSLVGLIFVPRAIRALIRAVRAA